MQLIRQVLSNEESRAKYDESGKAGLDQPTGFMDPSTFYMLVFGSDGFETFIGELQLASLFSAAEEDDVRIYRYIYK